MTVKHSQQLRHPERSEFPMGFYGMSEVDGCYGNEFG